MHILAINLFLIAQFWMPMAADTGAPPATQPAPVATTQQSAEATTQPASRKDISWRKILSG